MKMKTSSWMRKKKTRERPWVDYVDDDGLHPESLSPMMVLNLDVFMALRPW